VILYPMARHPPLHLTLELNWLIARTVFTTMLFVLEDVVIDDRCTQNGWRSTFISLSLFCGSNDVKALSLVKRDRDDTISRHTSRCYGPQLRVMGRVGLNSFSSSRTKCNNCEIVFFKHQVQFNLWPARGQLHIVQRIGDRRTLSGLLLVYL